MKAIVIGSGPGGFPAALKLKESGADVKIIEAWDFGGTCLNRGCIPSKALLEVSHRAHNFSEILGLAETKPQTEPKTTFSWEKIRNRKREIVAGLRTSLENVFRAKKIEVVKGKAVFLSGSSVSVATAEGPRTLDFDRAVLAVGTRPAYPPPFNSCAYNLVDSDNVFELEKFPSRLVIIGAGAVGLELGCFFNALGSKVEIIEIAEKILPSEDFRIAGVLKNSLEKRGIKFHLGAKARNVSFNGRKAVELETGESIAGDEILVAAGRKANIEEIGLEKARVERGKWVKVDGGMRTSNPGIFAVGDVNGISLLAHSAERQGEIAAENIMGKNETFDPAIVPKCVYTWPELASVGLNEKEAADKGIKTKTRHSYFRALGRAAASINPEGLCQIITGENGNVIGGQIAGGPATEMIHVLALAVKFKMNIKNLNSIIYAHPTMTEIIKEASRK